MKIIDPCFLAKAFSAFAFLALAAHANAQLNDDFNTGSFKETWSTDRYTPHTFDIVSDPFAATDGGTHGSVLDIGVAQSDHQSGYSNPQSIGFYNTQGKTTAVSANGAWDINVQLYITPQMVTGTANYRTNVWGRNSPDGSEAEANYAILGASNELGNGLQWEVYTSAGAYSDIGAITQAGWYDLDITYTATHGVYYSVYDSSSNQVAYLDDTGFTDLPFLTNAYVQAANLPQADNAPDPLDYFYDSISAGLQQSLPTPVPEPSTCGLIAAAGLVGLVARKFTKKKISAF